MLCPVDDRRRWLNRDKCLLNPDSISIERPGADNSAVIEMAEVPAGISCHVFVNPDKNHQTYLADLEDPDCIMFVESETGLELHIVEAKKTINTTSYPKAKSQIAAGIRHAHGLAPFISDRPIISVCCHVVYRDDRLDPLTSSDPVQFKSGLHPDDVRDWSSAVISLNLPPKLAVRKLNHRVGADGHMFLNIHEC